MGQMPLYQRMNDRPWWSTVAPCSRAALVDVALTLAAAIPFVALGRRRTSSLGPWLAMIATGAAIAIVVEKTGVAGGRWAYTGDMPTVPWLRLGVLPILQMMLLPALSAWATLRPRRARAGPM